METRITVTTEESGERIDALLACQEAIRSRSAAAKLLEESVLTGLEEYLQDEKIRPLTDKVTVKAPTALNFGIDLTYYINASNSATAALIQTQVTKAVEEYVTWQTTEIGKDINPSELISRVVKAGAKRVEVTSPVFTRVGGEQVAQCTSKTVNYGGLEDD